MRLILQCCQIYDTEDYLNLDFSFSVTQICVKVNCLVHPFRSFSNSNKSYSKSYSNLIEILFLCNHIVVGTWTNFTVGFTLDANKLMHSHNKTFSNRILNVATLIKGKTPVSDSLFVSDFVWEIFKKLIIISGCNWNQSTQLRITRGGKPYDLFICPHWRRSKTNYWRSSKI